MNKDKKIPGMRNIKNMGATIKTPLSSSRDSAYLDLYILDKKKAMLEKECLSLDQRKAELLEKIADINTKMKELQEKEGIKEKEMRDKMVESGDKTWKTMKVDY